MKNKKNRKLIFLVIIMLLTVWLTGCHNNMVVQKYVYNDQNYQMGNMAFTEDITKIYVDWIIGDVIVQKSNYDELIIRDEVVVELPDDYKMRYYYSNGFLDIKFTKSMENINYNFKIKKLYIFVPERLNDICISVSSESSSIVFKDISCDEIEIENVSGDVDLQNITNRSVSIETVSGEVYLFNNNINDIEIDTVSGNIGVTFNEMPNDLTADSVSGNIKL